MMKVNNNKIINKIKQDRAITLIALVLTIIVLIIISSVSIGIILGNNGLINRAKTAKSEYQNSIDDENKKLEEIYSKLLIADTNGSSLENVDMATLKKLILDSTYPIGSIFITIDGTNPSSTLGGEWEQVSQGRTLFGAGTLNDITYTTNTTIDAGLPNITGTLTSWWGHFQPQAFEGAFYKGSNRVNAAANGTNAGADQAYFDASKSNSIYGNSETVQPNAFVTYMWKRIS